MICSSVLNSVNTRSPVIMVLHLAKKRPSQHHSGQRQEGSQPPQATQRLCPVVRAASPTLTLTSCPRPARPLRTAGCTTLFLQKTNRRGEPASPLPARRADALHPRGSSWLLCPGLRAPRRAQATILLGPFVRGFCRCCIRKNQHVLNVPRVTGAGLTFYDLILRSIPGAYVLH